MQGVIGRFAAGAAVIGAGAVAWVFESGRMATVSSSSCSPPSSNRRTKSAIVVGSGIVGVCTAYSLCKRGYDVTVLEASKTGGEAGAAFGNAGTIGLGKTISLARADKGVWSILRGFMPGNAPIPDDRDPDHQLHKTNTFLSKSSFLDPLFLQWGLCWLRLLYDTRGHDMQDHSWESRARAAQDAVFQIAHTEKFADIVGMRRGGSLKVRVSPPTPESTPHPTPSALDLERWPLLAPMASRGYVVGAHIAEDDGEGDCAAFVRELQQVCEAKYNAVWHDGTRAVEILQENGKASGIRDSGGRSHCADIVAVCAGWQSTPLLLTAGVFAPVFPLRGYSLTVQCKGRLKTLPRGQPYVRVDPYALYMKQYPGNRLRFTCYGEIVPFAQAATPNAELHQRLEALVRYVCPTIDDYADVESGRRWMGCRPLTPDAHPIIGATRVPGLFLNTGHSFTGWKYCAQSAEIMAECAEAGSNQPMGQLGLIYSLERFRLVRPF